MGCNITKCPRLLQENFEHFTNFKSPLLSDLWFQDIKTTQTRSETYLSQAQVSCEWDAMQRKSVLDKMGEFQAICVTLLNSSVAGGNLYTTCKNKSLLYFPCPNCLLVQIKRTSASTVYMYWQLRYFKTKNSGEIGFTFTKFAKLFEENFEGFTIFSTPLL